MNKARLESNVNIVLNSYYNRKLKKSKIRTEKKVNNEYD